MPRYFKARVSPWCASASGLGSTIETTTDGVTDPIVWAVGAESDNKLHGFDGDTGASVFSGGPTAFGTVRRYSAPMVAKGRIYVASDNAVHALVP